MKERKWTGHTLRKDSQATDKISIEILRDGVERRPKGTWRTVEI
jgi:hypothetical protein